jgi:dihydrofolate synthase/folylpolyglutamate synthase
LADILRALTDLYARIPLGMRLGLGPMRAACDACGNPERALRIVHVAGTNGKGSVCAMLEAILRADGRRTGLYTSPHLMRFAERIRLGGQPIDDDALASLLGDLLARFSDLSFFETATLAALLAFRDARVDVAILEVGLGGRLDATNVIPTPVAAAITRIALDHTDRLGPTLLDIAREKAGIAKPGLILCLGPMQDDVRRAIDGTARGAGASTVLASDDKAAVRIARRVEVGLAGQHQIENAVVAAALAARVGSSEEARALGLERVRWPGRLETLLTRDGEVLLDAAHNLDGIDALARHIEYQGRPQDTVALVFGVLADKAWGAMLDRIAPLGSHRVYVRPVGRAAVEPHDLAQRHPGAIAPDAGNACARARAAVGSSGLVVVCGSILLIGDARAKLLGLPRDPPVAL